VVVGDVDEAAGRQLAAESNGCIAFRRTDVTQADDIEAVMRITHESGGLDIVFNNAGAGGAREPIDEISADDWDRTMALLLRSVALGIRFAAPLIAARGGGSIVNTSSVSALGTGYAPTAYSTAKAGVLHLTKMAAANLAKSNIRVNAVVPGFITTSIFTRHLDIPADRRKMADTMIAGAAAKAQPIPRAGRAEDIAAAVTFLASEEASFITGTHILVDGGLTIGTRASWDPNEPSMLTALDAFK
jgi:NAD(P)-dependent dehydrogenase (short-subunit alcohol dehydrogenase family)